MNKVAQEKIARALFERFHGGYWREASAPSVDYFQSMAHLVLTEAEELGYRKLPKDRPELREKIDALLTRLGERYDGASHPKLLVRTHRDEILALIESPKGSRY